MSEICNPRSSTGKELDGELVLGTEFSKLGLQVRLNESIDILRGKIGNESDGEFAFKQKDERTVSKGTDWGGGGGGFKTKTKSKPTVDGSGNNSLGSSARESAFNTMDGQAR